MKKLSRIAVVAFAQLAYASTEVAASEDRAKLENFTVAGHNAFVILPSKAPADKPMRWVWYAPTLRGLPGSAEQWMFDRFHAAGIAVAGVEVGESSAGCHGRPARERPLRPWRTWPLRSGRLNAVLFQEVDRKSRGKVSPKRPECH